MVRPAGVCLWWLVVGCTAPTTPTGASDPDTDADSDSDSDTDTDTDSDSDSDTDTDAPDPVDLAARGGRATVTLPPWPGLGRFVPAGDTLALDAVGTNLSGVTWNADTGTYFVVRDSGGVVFEYSADFSVMHREIELLDLAERDLEGIAWLGEAQFAIANEGNKPIVLTIPDDGTTRIIADSRRDDVQELRLPPASGSNTGLEGICYDPRGGGRFYAVQEKAPMRVFAFDRPDHGRDVSYADGSLRVDEIFDPEVALDGIVTDLSGCHWNPHVDRLLVMSHEAARVLDVRMDGTVFGILGVEGARKFEGVTLGPNGVLVAVGEPDNVRMYGVH